ncbi:MAG: hypothetical protein JKY54_09195 [Flavobacteriales bacterium]|jgi:hypothetical protein|nr:hypothetical protein [Flavobacteriales bacterium]
MSLLEKIYNKLLMITPGSDVFSMQTLLLCFYVIALLLAIYRANKNRERLTDFLTIVTACVKYGLTAVLVETFLNFTRLKDHPQVNAQMLYLYLFFINVIFVIILFYLHIKLSYVFGRLYQTVRRIFLFHGFLHLAIWLKLYVLNIQIEYEFLNYAYSFLVLYFSITLAIAMIKPKILNNFIVENIIAPSSALLTIKKDT